MFRRNLLINFAVKVLKKYLAKKISYTPLREYVEGQIEKLKFVINVLTDKDPDNKEQLKQLWNLHKKNIADDSLEFAASIVLDKIKDKDIAEEVSELILSLRGDDEG